MEESNISETLEALSNGATAKKTSRHIHTLRGIRGTPQAEIAKVAAAAWETDPPSVHDEGSLQRLFGTAWEDGLVAIGLLAALVPDAPQDVLEIGLEWLERVDDVATADALGWLVLGPAFCSSGADPVRLKATFSPRKTHHPAARRALVAMGLSMLPLPLQGPAAAPLRARYNEKNVMFVEEALTPLLNVIAHTFLRDESTPVRKALRRLLKEWSRADPCGVVAWQSEVRGGLPKLLSAETKRAHSRCPQP